MRAPLALALAALAAAPAAHAQNTVSGHVGAIVPIVTVGDETTTVSDNFVVGFPFGIGVGRAGSPVRFDLELVPLVDPDPQRVELLVHPGLIYAVGSDVAVGVRAAFEVDGDVYGFTPLVAYGRPAGRGVNVFFELDVPVRFATDAQGGTVSSVAIVPHIGLAF